MNDVDRDLGRSPLWTGRPAFRESIMRDESYDRDIRFARQHFGRDLDFLGTAIGDVFATLTRIRFDAPWRRSSTGHGKTCG